jgi:hypothetical protein
VPAQLKHDFLVPVYKSMKCDNVHDVANFRKIAPDCVYGSIFSKIFIDRAQGR